MIESATFFPQQPPVGEAAPLFMGNPLPWRLDGADTIDAAGFIVTSANGVRRDLVHVANAHPKAVDALELIALISEGSTSANSLRHIARIAREALDQLERRA